jgi:hypothetical protein
MENEVIAALIENNGEDIVNSHINGIMHESYSDHFIRDFITTFEDTKRKKVSSRKKKGETQNADAIASAT